MIGVLKVLLLASGGLALRSPSYTDDYDSPQAPTLRHPDGDPRPALRSGAAKVSVGYDSPRPFRSSPSGYQFSSFRGPVSGNIEEIEVPFVLPQGAAAYADSRNPLPSKSVDYVAKPDYSFTYGMHDPESGVAQAQAEAREGDTVKGEYSVMEPDGTLRTVTYVADPVHGFQASVKYGPSGLPPPPPPTPTPTSGYTGPAAQPPPAPKAPRPLPHRFKLARPAPLAARPPPVYRGYQEYDDV